MTAIAVAIFSLCFINIVTFVVNIMIGIEHHQEMMNMQNMFLNIQMQHTKDVDEQRKLNNAMMQASLDLRERELKQQQEKSK